MKIFLIILSFILLSGCASVSRGSFKHTLAEPTEGLTANLTFETEKKRDGFGFVAAPFTAIFHENCSDIANESKKDIAKDGYFGDITVSLEPEFGNPRTIKVKANKVIYVQFGLMNLPNYECMAKFRFSPKAGGNYHFLYSSEWGSCKIESKNIELDGRFSEIENIKMFKSKEGLFQSTGSYSPEWRLCKNINN